MQYWQFYPETKRACLMEVMYLLLNLLFLGWVIFLLRRRVKDPFLQAVFWPALVLKLGSGILLGLFYRYYLNGGDTFVYQQQAEILSQYAQQNLPNYLQFILTGKYESVYLYDVMKYRGYSNSFFIVRWLNFLNFITGSSYYLNSLYFSFFSFWGTWRLTQTIAVIFPGTQAAAALAFLFFPSVVFWSSGILKESLLLGSSCLLLATVLNLVYRPGWQPVREIFLLGLAAYICFKIRFYFTVAYFPLLFSFAFTERAANRLPRLQMARNRFFFYSGTLVLLGYIASFLHEALNVQYFFTQLIKSYYGLKAVSETKAFIDLPDLQPTFASILFYTPKAIASAIFRPFIGEINTVPYLLTGLENLLIVVLVALAVISFRRSTSPLPGTLICSLLLYVFLVAALIGLSTPNLGTLSRYKVAFMPFLLYLLLQTGIVGVYLQRMLGRLQHSGKGV